VVLDRLWISEHLPHRGSMCLLDAVLDWDGTDIRCRATSHRVGTNPLRSHGQLSAVCGIEYAVQAMAIHSALLANAVPRRGLLLNVRDVSLHVPRLDDSLSDLLVSASYVHADLSIAQYRFSVSDERRLLVDGRAIVMPDVGAVT
jgi:predicted hotdog family 3-hydroxylacyl-ACP dehydratase